jgi:FAD/FMN-containing dehydrogenase
MDHELSAHALRVAEAAAQLKQATAGPLALAKTTSNLFRDRRAAPRHRIDLRPLHHVLGHDANAGWVDAEGCTSYEDLVAATLLQGRMPAVVPQLKTITIGGAAAGVGIEATSFRHGLVHDTLLEIEVLLPDGELVVCSPDNEQRDLFFGFPNSYGTLGYAVRVRAATLPVLPAVHVRHHHFAAADEFLDAVQDACAGTADFVDGVVFSRGEQVLSVGRFVRDAPWRSDYSYQDIYWQSLRTRRDDYLATPDYLWRWDTDWFWCSRNFGADHALVRWLLGPQRLNSRTYTRWMRAASRWQVADRAARWRGLYRESVIQDVDIPIARAAEFLEFLHREIGILPVWICPIRGEVGERRFPLYRLPAPRYVNVGFWDAVTTRRRVEPGHFNRLIEREVLRLGGIKSLYSDSCFTREDFDGAYGGEAYRRLKAKYDPAGRAPGLYEKCVGRS